jgi:hypothetical protein
MFSEVSEVWVWLDRLFEPNIISDAIQYDFEKCPDRYSPEEWYVSFLQLKASSLQAMTFSCGIWP